MLAYGTTGFLYFELSQNPDLAWTDGLWYTLVTMTTVGYGDMVPHTPLGQMIATLVMLVGYSVLAVPTGIVTSELVVQLQRQQTERRCPSCERLGHERDASYCRHCGARLDDGDTG